MDARRPAWLLETTMIALAVCLLHIALAPAPPCLRTPLPEPHPVTTSIRPGERHTHEWRT
jgi:hypothetical protein